ncbi:hypothetical protein O1611_g6871 [Lasiodiplodia mahajangana]|uniref:Uncharacterized protein n=1 Tax=Lasiodiplodia mahajangana TaxID=1108764 RepID=A0ACC2JH64_9PEZI|nr:hypothetical protein O1611_g6871 [Lasiodiplodia mahajangana]
MAAFRDLLPKPPTEIQVLSVYPGSRVTKQRRYHHIPTEWENRRQTIIKLYVEKRKTADEVIEILKSEFSFTTGRRQLYNKLKEWGVQKNNRQIENTATIIPNTATDEIPRSPEDAYLHGISFTPMTQFSDTYQSRQPTPVASPGSAIRSPQSMGPHLVASPFAQPLWPDFPSFDEIDFNTPKLPSDDNMDHPWALAGGLAPQSPRQERLATAEISRIPSPSLSIMLREITPRDTSTTPLHLSPKKPLMAVGRPDLSSPQARMSLERRLSRVIDFIAQNGCAIGHSSALRLKEDIEAILDISQAVEEEPGNCILNLFCSHAGPSEGLGLAKELINSAPTLALNGDNIERSPNHLTPAPRIGWRRRFKKVCLGGATLTIEERISGKYLSRLDHVDDTAEWHFRTKIVLKPKGSTRALHIEVYLYETPDQLISTIPRLSVNNIVSRKSRVFQVAATGSVQELMELFSRGQANLRDHDRDGWSLLHYSLKNPPMCRFLIDNGLDVDEVAIHKRYITLELTPLLLCYRSMHLETLGILLAAGADPTVDTRGNPTVLSLVCDDIIPEVSTTNPQNIYHGQDVALAPTRDLILRTPLLSACTIDGDRIADRINNPAQKIKLLLNRGSDIKDTCMEGSCLHVLFRSRMKSPSQQSLLEALTLLVRSGADVNSQDDYGNTVSEIAYAEHTCWETHEKCDLGSYRGDLWDAALDLCGKQISEFRKNYPRRARYTAAYTRQDFEMLWEGRESSCPYWDDITDPLYGAQIQVPKYARSSQKVLCVCRPDLETRWMDVDDPDRECYYLGYTPSSSDDESDLSEWSSDYGEDSDDLEIMDDGARGGYEDLGVDNMIWQ